MPLAEINILEVEAKIKIELALKISKILLLPSSLDLTQFFEIDINSKQLKSKGLRIQPATVQVVLLHKSQPKINKSNTLVYGYLLQSKNSER